MACLLNTQVVLADSLISLEKGARVTMTHKDVLLIQDGRKQTLIDMFEVRSEASRLLWIKPFPEKTPRAEASAELFDTLRKQTTIQEPYNEAIRRNLFGPSVVTLLTRRFMTPPPPPEFEDTSEKRTLSIEAQAFFKGEVTTSTITRGYVLPAEFADWLRRYAAEITEDDKRSIAGHLNRGWGVSVALVRDRAPSSDTTARLGPYRYDYQRVRLLYPQLIEPTRFSVPVESEFYLIANKSLAAVTYPTVWDERSWEKQPPKERAFLTTFNRALEKGDEIDFSLREQAGLSLPQNPHLVRTRFKRPQRDGRVDLEFRPTLNGVKIPGSGAAGSGRDIFLCILLGLTPLIYTPESWFFLWLAGRARARARAQGSAFGVRLWAIFVFAVAFYWFATQQNFGRLAAVIPMLIGIGQLALPYTERDPFPVRAQIRKKS